MSTFLPNELRLALTEPPSPGVAPLLRRWERGELGYERKDGALIVEASALQRLSEDELAAVGVRRFAGPLGVRELGAPGGASYAWRFKWPDGHDGHAGCWRLAPDGVHELLPSELTEALRLASSVEGSSRATVYRAIRRLTGLASRCGALQLASTLRDVQVREVDMVRLDVYGDELDPKPVARLLAKLDEPDVEDDWAPSEPERTERATVEVSPERWQRELAVGLREDALVKIGDKEFVIIPRGVFQNLLMTEAARLSTLDERAKFLQNPLEYLPDDGAFDEAHYSSRVVGVGDAPRGQERSTGEARVWATPLEGLRLETDAGPVWVPKDQLLSLAEAMRDASGRGDTSIEWSGHALPVSNDLAIELERAARPARTNDGANDVAPPGQCRVLQIRDNLITVDWAPLVDGGRHAPADALPPLAGGMSLQPHQHEALARLRDLWIRGLPGALLCDDMGLGKTLQALVFATWVRQQLRAGGGRTEGARVHVPIVVVATPSLLQNWLEELAARLEPGTLKRVLWADGTKPSKKYDFELQFLNDFRCDARSKAAQTGNKAVLEHARLDLAAIDAFQPDMLLIGYDKLRSLQHAVGELRIGVVLADEVQAAKNPTSLRSVALRAMNYDFAVAVTGTPIENSWVDLWTICDFAVPGHLGAQKSFQADYPQSGDVEATGSALAKRLEGVMIRRVRGTTLKGLPPCDFQSIERGMPLQQAIAYQGAASRAREGAGKSLGLLQELAAVSLHPRPRALLQTAAEARAWLRESARTAVLLDTLEAWSVDPQPVLLFVRSLAVQNSLADALKLVFGWPHVEVLNGEKSQAERHRIRQRTVDGEGFRALIVSPEVGGAGWNFQFASRSIILERPYNPAVEAQVIGRTWRLGQTRPVEVVAPVAVLTNTLTFDQVLDKLLQDKRELAQSVLAPADVSSQEHAERFSVLLGGAAG